MKRYGAAFISVAILTGFIGIAAARLADANQDVVPAPREPSGTPGAGSSHALRPGVPAHDSDHSASEVPMKRVTGIGGVFFKAKDAPALREWYKRHLGIDVQTWGGAAFHWTDAGGKPTGGATAWLIAAPDSQQFAPTQAPFMINYRVDDLHALLKALKSEGCNVLDEVTESDYGQFGWVIDPEGNKVELWQPPVNG